MGGTGKLVCPWARCHVYARVGMLRSIVSRATAPGHALTIPNATIEPAYNLQMPRGLATDCERGGQCLGLALRRRSGANG